MRFLLPFVLLAGCDRGKDVGATHAPSGTAASGSLVFTPRTSAEADVFLATESEVLKSGPIRHQAAEADRTPELAADDITVTRRPGTMILDVHVRLPDLAVAAARCNRLLQTYFDYRRSMKLEALSMQAMALSQELERTPDNAALKEKLLDLDLKRMTLENDVRLLEPCRMPGAPAAR